MNPPKKKRNNRIVKLRDKNKLSFNYISRIEGLNVKTIFEIYKREKQVNQTVDKPSK